MTRTLAERLVDAAVSQLGVAEVPLGSNAGPCLKYALHGEEPLPWCARFVRWCFKEVGAPIPGNEWDQGAVAVMHRIFDEHGWLVREPQPGDVRFSRRLDPRNPKAMHVSIVERVMADGRVITIGGNEGDAVRRVYREPAELDLVAYGRRPDPLAT